MPQGREVVRRFVIYWLPVIIYAIAIYVVSSIQQPLKSIEFFPYSDKLLHFLEYAIFAFLMIRALCSLRSNHKILYLRIAAVAIVVFYGFTDEIHQCFVPQRDMSIFDLLSDSLGALVGQAFFRR